MAMTIGAGNDQKNELELPNDTIMYSGFRLDRLFGFLVVTALFGILIGFEITEREMWHHSPAVVLQGYFWLVIVRMSLASAIGLGVGLALDAYITDATKRLNVLTCLWILLALLTMLIPAIQRAS